MSDNTLEKFVKTMRQIHSDCAWNSAQTHASLAKYIIEEAHEAAAAMQKGDDDNAIKSELGDVLLQIVLNSIIAEERGAFDLDAIIDCINEKMRRRHPHVFAGAKAESIEDIIRLWQEAKSKENSHKTEDLSAVYPVKAQTHKIIEKKLHKPNNMTSKLYQYWQETQDETISFAEFIAKLNFSLEESCIQNNWDLDDLNRKHNLKILATATTTSLS